MNSMKSLGIAMTDPFASSRQKLARAEKHFLGLQEEIQSFGQKQPYKRVVELHPQKPGHTIFKIRMTEELPPSIADTTADIVGSLRSALDNAGYDIAVAAGIKEPKNSAFPFAGSVDQMSGALGRCKDIPQPIHSLFCGFQPYKGGNDILWALNQVAITDKHKMVVPIGQGFVRHGVHVQGTGFVRMPDPHVWDRAKNEMIIIELGPGAEYDYNFNFTFFIAFNGIEIIDGKPIVGTLTQFGSIVERILMAMEAECRRLKIFK
jgi:hypothetical protein